MKHHWVRGQSALGFGVDRLRTLVSLATDSSHRFIMGKIVLPIFFSTVFHPIIFILADNYGIYNTSGKFEKRHCHFYRLLIFILAGNSEIQKSKRKAMNRNCSNQKTNPALKTKTGNK